MYLSIVIPVFNESKKVRNDIEAASKFFTESNLTGEIIVVDDGSQDETAKIAQETIVPQQINLTVVRHAINKGKGYSVRVGMKMAKGQYAMFCDSGSCIPYSYALKGLEMISSDKCLIAHASRRLPSSIISRPQTLSRQLISKAFRTFVMIFIGVPLRFTDTQCGFKIYRGDVAREIFSECESDGFTFDVEVLMRALSKGYRVLEFPVEWKSDPDSRVLPLKMSWRVFWEFVKMKKNLLFKILKKC